MPSKIKQFAAIFLTGTLLMGSYGGNCNDDLLYDQFYYDYGYYGDPYGGYGYDYDNWGGGYYDDGYYYEEEVYYDDCWCGDDWGWF